MTVTCDAMMGNCRYFVGKKAMFDSESKKGEPPLSYLTGLLQDFVSVGAKCVLYFKSSTYVVLITSCDQGKINFYCPSLPPKIALLCCTNFGVH